MKLAAALALLATASAQLVAPALDRLPVGRIMPAGWLKAEEELMAAGSTFGLGFWSGGGISASKWLADPKKTGGEEQGGEYFMNGFVPLTCQVDSAAMRDLREAAITKILGAVGSTGMLGGDIPRDVDYDQNENYWGRMIIALALQSYAECEGPYAPNATAQDAVVDALVVHHKAMEAQIKDEQPKFTHNPWGYARYDEILISCQWLIDRGRNDSELWSLMDLVRTQADARLPWEDYFTGGDPFHPPSDVHCWPNKSDATEKNFMIHHGVNIMEAIKTGPTWYRVSGNATDLGNAATALAWIDAWERSADGTFTAPDCFAQLPNLPTNGVETCSVVEAMYSLRTSYELNADVALFDRLEWVAFNAMPATTNDRFTGNAYYHSVNQIQLGGKSGYGANQRDDFREISTGETTKRRHRRASVGMNGCCTGNVHQGWPKFVMAQLQTADAGATIVVSGYSPFAATLPTANVSVGGQYPFADNATISVARTPGKAWKLRLRVPCWADAASLVVAGGATVDAPPCALFDVPGLAADDASFEATLLFTHSIKVLEDKWTNPKGAVEITRGPLLFSFPVPGRRNTTSLNGTYVETTFVMVDAGAPWQIALVDPTDAASLTFGGFEALTAGLPFDRDRPPAKITAKAKVTTGVKSYDKGYVPDSPVQSKYANGSVVDVDLVPLAHTYLRLTVLPVMENATA